MPRPLLPPDGWGRVSAKVLFEKGLSPVVRDTYVMLRMLAWNGNETPELSWEQIAKETGKPRATVYRHLLELATTGVMHWRPANTGTIVVTFTDGIGSQSQFWEEAPPQGNAFKSKDLKGKTIKPKEERNLKIETVKANYFPLAQTLAEVCHMQFDPNRGRLFREAKLLSKAEPTPTPELIKEHYNGRPECYWRKHDWRGKKGENPSPATIRETWAQWETAVDRSDWRTGGLSATEQLIAYTRELRANGDPSGSE